MTRRGLWLVVLAMLAGCGGETHSAPPPPSTSAKPDAPPLVYMSRNTLWAVPDEVTVYADGRVVYRLLLHTKFNLKAQHTKLSPAALSQVKRLVAGARLNGADRAGSTQPRAGFSYLLRINGRSITTVDGKLTAGVRPLIRRLGKLQDRLVLTDR
jgi:hypothetical protein